MRRGAHTGATAAVLQALAEIGPMTNGELAAYLGRDHVQIRSATSRLNKRPKRISIKDWRFDEEGQRSYPRPIYALGAFKDAEQPARDTNEVKRRYRRNMTARLRSSFVFNLGRPMKELLNEARTG